MHEKIQFKSIICDSFTEFNTYFDFHSALDTNKK